MMTPLRRTLALSASVSAVSTIALLLGSAGCSGDDVTGGPDGGTNTDATTDQGNPHPDTGAPDTGNKDTGVTDTGNPDTGDGGTPEASTNILIADQYNNRVIEIDRTGKIVWTFGDGSQTPGPTSIIGPNDAERIPGLTSATETTLIAGTGIPTAMSGCDAGGACLDNRVVIVDHSGTIVWQYGQAGQTGNGPNLLNVPAAATMTPTGNVLIVDQGNARIIEVDYAMKTIVWQFPAAADGGGLVDAGALTLNNPNSVELVPPTAMYPKGTYLIADENNSRVLEVDPTGNLVWMYPPTGSSVVLNQVAFASRLPNGNTLITDVGDAVILEVTPANAIVWSYNTLDRTLGGADAGTPVDGGNAMPQPTRAVRLANGDTLISDQFNDQVFEIDITGKVVFNYGQLNNPGNGPGQLNGPYDGKQIGDFTGLTAPPPPK